jgi:KipI family sensor histidine kinase inhibitor
VLLEAAEPQSLAAALTEAAPSGLLDAVPGARTLLVLFDPEGFDPSQLASLRPSARVAEPRTVRLRAVYDGADLDAVAAELGISAAEVVRRHAEAEHRVAFLGFAPGFAYMTGGLPVPRLGTPRVRLPAGSVAVAGGYTAVYPTESPGGWRLLGRVAERMFDPTASPPSLLRPGDRVVFEPAQELPELPPLRLPPARGEPVLRLLAPGPFTTVQGGPRYGLAAYGVPAGGAMDLASLAAANALAGNPPLAAGLEITLAGPELEALADLRVALRGELLSLRRGERLRCGPVRRGVREYLAVEGGLEPPLPGLPLRPLRSGDLVRRAEGPEKKNNYFFSARRPPSLPAETNREIRAMRGPQWDAFTGPERFFSTEWIVSPQSDRRGLRLQGPPLALSRAADIPPEGTAPGAVQVPGDGQPIALGPDRPVTGGYAKIATVIWADLPLLAQARPGARLRFREVTLAEAT